MTRLPSFLHDDSGSTLVEFALSLSVLLAVIFGCIDFSRAMYVCTFLPYAAGEGSRYAAVRGASWGSALCTGTTTFSCNATGANITTYVRSLAPPGVTAANVTVTALWPGTTASNSACSTTGSKNLPGCLVSVKTSYSFSFVLPFLPTGALNLGATSTRTIQQ